MQLASGRVLSLSLALRSFLAFECFHWRRAFAWQGGMRRHSEGNTIFWFMAHVPSSLWSIFAPGTWGALRPLWLWPPCSASQCFSYVADNQRANGTSDVSFWGVGLFTTFCRLTPKVRIYNQLAIRGLYRSTEAGSQLSCLTSCSGRMCPPGVSFAGPQVQIEINYPTIYIPSGWQDFGTINSAPYPSITPILSRILIHPFMFGYCSADLGSAERKAPWKAIKTAGAQHTGDARVGADTSTEPRWVHWRFWLQESFYDAKLVYECKCTWVKYVK